MEETQEAMANSKNSKRKIRQKEPSSGMKKYQEMRERIGLGDHTPLTKNSSHSVAVSAQRSSMQTMGRLDSMAAISSQGGVQ